MITVITAIYGDHDALTEPPTQTVDANWVCVTDNPRLNDRGYWEVINDPRSHLHPRMAAKVPKCLPHLYSDADTTVWVDGSFRFLTEHTLGDILEAHEAAPQSQIVHPWRDCIYDEADASEGMLKYQGQAVQAQVDQYRQDGHPEHWGLWATGLIVRTGNAGWVQELGRHWLVEQACWTYQDQLSQAPIMNRLGQRVHDLPFSLHGSGIFEWHNHSSEA